MNTTFSQVTIRERVVISPDSTIKEHQQLTGSITFKVVVHAPDVYTHNPDNPDEPWSSALVIKRVAECWLYEEASLSTGDAVLEINALTGIYNVYAMFQSPTGYATADVYSNGSLILHIETNSGGTFQIGNFGLYNDFNLGGPGELYPCGEATVSIAPVLTFCGDNGYDKLSDPFTLTITLYKRSKSREKDIQCRYFLTM
ncbi:MAG: hypothetical protein HY964_03070 [Ignavibacteriales bacterium]|nr:hypothetical protein [Ignavibacteriales bacterium]